MKHLFRKTALGLSIVMALGLYSCNTFENEPLERLSEDQAFNPTDSTAKYFTQSFFAIYAQLPDLHNRISQNYLDAGTDDAVPTIYTNDGVESFRNGRLSPSNTVDGLSMWSLCYTGIRRANLFLSKWDAQPATNKLPEPSRTYMKGEAILLRAYFYFELLKRWDGVPIVYDKVYNLEDTINVPRSSRNECVDYINAQIDDAMKYLPAANVAASSDPMYYRMNKGVALALRSRLALYLASPLYNPTNDLTKWQAAADAAKAVINLNVYSLHTTSPGFQTLFVTLKNNEVIMGNVITSSSGSNSVELNNSPCGYYTSAFRCNGYTSPSQNLVDAFLTINGKTIDKDPTYNPQDPYKNRDPRLKYTVFYNGSTWLKRSVETFEGGLDKPNRQTAQTQTGYYLRKFMGNNETSSSLASQKRAYNIIRYAEILLNYVEALNEVNKDNPDIITYMKQIRSRAGITAGSDGRYGLPTTFTQSEMREIIRNERRIELAFEEHRFWDIRRWKIAETVMNQPIKGMVITKQADGTFTYATTNVRTQQFDASKMYWYPIPRNEMVANSALTQNIGWNY
ncbi:RagB/SusD family nutrient uptake outer membrane protein [Bacteroides sedimenti]|uniref:RagB/SusD family nutrient uptake outer membrane protein n=1 Tax=Bacteroides sedimenti TaxID=2136147 RepID=A0ABN6Z7U0_9BACE